ncbi:class I SAM-dependent methyltransferase [Kitasatospora sp. CM 4170]|uniref:Methyltransferase domain-containing protein n=1 Tax=Kitasatospora aburaviensis TaxID=67265 RepID=A0ABW1FB79_9ACTN|nr:class I SAM-dependent methyltransferase [Kitasatospora sp. CM 4170]WNM43231.1 class I SAM-dependent methyltransferase [Kitasatospora sp. CM 4170]
MTETVTPEPAFTPALGRLAPTRFYDPVIVLTRERLWRALAAMHVAPRPEDVVVDVGCGTGSLALLLHRVEPRARIIGVDPDPAMLDRARRKAAAAPTAAPSSSPARSPEWHVGMGDTLPELLGTGIADTVVSSLVLHQCPLAVKRAILGAMAAVLRPGGRLVIADYGLQRTALMRLAFRGVQFADGREDTQPQADGVLPRLIHEAGFHEVREAEVVPTVTGSISVYVATRD